MTTVSEVLAHLKKDGYTADFNLTDTCLVCPESALRLHPTEFVVDRHYRFEGASDPGDEAVVYAISSPVHHVKGTLVNGYGMYSETLADDLVKALREPATASAPAPAEKHNIATPQRPEGNRLLDAPLVTMDLVALRHQIKQESAWRSSDRNAITLLKTNGLRVVLLALHAGAELKTHTAPGVLSLQVLEGRLSFQTEPQAAELTRGELLTLHAGIPHRVTAHEDSVFLLSIAMAAA
ncbi:cupin domain-containing protein [Hymenobacter terricola]|uniref:cupin domain-containing protein n=1 Tax=Hymenobacter terricola TaxID=2819236 RepID=UPI001B305926|nr:cupin domain-containing protein [Hymenobacter terricola]